MVSGSHRWPGAETQREAAIHFVCPSACCCPSRQLPLALKDLAAGYLATWLLIPDPTTCIHRRTGMLTQEHIYSQHVHIHSYIQEQVHTRPQAHKHAHSFMHIDAHLCTQAHPYTCEHRLTLLCPSMHCCVTLTLRKCEPRSIDLRQVIERPKKNTSPPW